MNNMIYIVWNEHNNLGINIIDEQHKGIVSLINSLHFSIVENYSKETLRPIADSLKNYTAIHFKTELYLLQKTKYPELQSHKKLHDQLSAITLRTTVEADNQGDPLILLKFLKEWWLNHINTEDKKYVPHILECLKKC